MEDIQEYVLKKRKVFKAIKVTRENIKDVAIVFGGLYVKGQEEIIFSDFVFAYIGWYVVDDGMYRKTYTEKQFLELFTAKDNES